MTLAYDFASPEAIVLATLRCQQFHLVPAKLDGMMSVNFARSAMQKWPTRIRVSCLTVFKFLIFVAVLATPAAAEPLSLNGLVTPSSEIQKDGKPVPFAIHGYIEFTSLAEAFIYIQSETRRWEGKISEEESRHLASALLREAIESRIVSMLDERPLETLLTHTSEELRKAILSVREPTPQGYVEAFLAVQDKWKRSLNCWSASPSIPGRVLSNWYPIEEGISLHGVVYDSTEHFWQAVKYHPDITIDDLNRLIVFFESQNWQAWLKRLEEDPQLYLPNAYAVEFLRLNLTAERIRWFREQLSTHRMQKADHARLVQQRNSNPFPFSAFEEKVLWGDLADLFHLVYTFSASDDPIRPRLANAHFDGIYLNDRKFGFISEEFRSQMLEIWKVKYLATPRFRELIAGIPQEVHLEHFLNDSDSPDIPIPIYVGYLNQIREMARAQATH
jgi:hypothetical protein